MLDGDNSEQPRLVYLPTTVEAKVGDRIVTVGAGGVFPPGLPVGVVASVDNGVIRVEPYAELSRLEVLRIVDFGLAGVLPQSAVPPPRAPDQSAEIGRCRIRTMSPVTCACRSPCSAISAIRGRLVPFLTTLLFAFVSVVPLQPAGLCRGDAGLRADGGVPLDDLSPRSAAAQRRLRAAACCSIS